MFHLNCFTCLVCRKQLSTGEELYVLEDNKFICKEDYLNGNRTAVMATGHHQGEFDILFLKKKNANSTLNLLLHHIILYTATPSTIKDAFPIGSKPRGRVRFKPRLRSHIPHISMAHAIISTGALQNKRPTTCTAHYKKIVD